MSLAVLNELEAIGLISCSFGLHRKITNVCKNLFSDGKTTECIMTDDNDQLSFGTVMLTKAGRYLNNISSTEIAEDHIAIVKEYFMKHGYSLDENNKLEIRINNDSFEIIKLR